MKAIINIKQKTSGFSHLNGRTFEIKELFSSFCAIQIPSQICDGRFDTCDFAYNEILIVDIDSEIQKAFDDHNWGSNTKAYIHLKNYCIAKKIKTNEQVTIFA
jgi:hypothetical protein